MAKKTQESLLGEVVQLLRKQNQLSTRDRLKESEEARRQEKLDTKILNPNTDANGAIQLDDGTDFKRRIKANIAGKVYKTKMDEPKNKAKKKVQEVIKHSTFMTRRLIEKSNKMMYRINVENANADLMRFKYRKAKDQEKEQTDEEYRREHGGEMFDFTKKFRKLIAGFLSPRELARQKKREEWSIIKQNWFKYGMVPLITALTGSIVLAYNGMHLWHTKALAALAAVKVWAGTTIGAWLSGGKIATAYTKLKTSIYKWFGYDKHGKPMYKKVDGQWKTFGWAGLTESVRTRLADLRLKAYNSMGLGEDGKKVVKKYTGGPRASMPVRAAWTSVGFIGLVTRRIGKLLNPLVKVSGGIAKWTAKAPYKAIAATLKTFSQLGAVKFIGRLLWPISAIFSIFEGFKAGKAEAGKEDAKWYTILGEAGGGAIGYLVGGLADAIKGLVVWGIRKMFGLETDKDGNILPGQGIGGDALAAIQKFSFADLIRKIIAFPFHALSAISDFVGQLFSDPVGTAKGMWEWITDMPRRIGNWFKGMIPEKVRKFFGIEFSEYDAKGMGLETSYLSDATKDYYSSVEYKKRMGINLTDKTPGLQPRLDEQSALALDIQNSRNQQAYEFRTQRQLDIANGAIDPMTQRPYGHVTNVNFHYKDAAYGDYVREARMEIQ